MELDLQLGRKEYKETRTQKGKTEEELSHYQNIEIIIWLVGREPNDSRIRETIGKKRFKPDRITNSTQGSRMIKDDGDQLEMFCQS